MAELVACLGTGKGTWGHVAKLINDEEWDNIFLIAHEFAKEKFSCEKKFEFVIINPDKFLPELIEDVKNGLKGRIKGTEAGVNLVSGSGKEHMAVISALLKLGLGIRLVAVTTKGVKEV